MNLTTAPSSFFLEEDTPPSSVSFRINLEQSSTRPNAMSGPFASLPALFKCAAVWIGVNETITAIRIYADVPYKKGHNVKMPPFCFCCTHMYGGALLFIFNKAYLQIVDLMHTFLCSSWGINTSYGITCLTIFYCAFLGFLTQLQVQHSNFGWSSTITTPTIHLSPIPDPSESYTLAVDEMELNYLRVDFIILFLNGVVSYLVNVMLDHIMVAPHPPERLHINNSLYMANHINNFIYIYIYMPNYINNSIYKARKQTATQFLMKMMSAGIRDKFNLKMGNSWRYMLALGYELIANIIFISFWETNWK